MPMALMCSAMLFTPPMLGLQTAYAAEQQQGTISGTVVDSQGEPIIGASVIIVGGQAVQGRADGRGVQGMVHGDLRQSERPEQGEEVPDRRVRGAGRMADGDRGRGGGEQGHR